jgi:hypothetical protein
MMAAAVGNSANSADALAYPPAPRAAQRIEQLEHEQRRLTEEVAELRQAMQELLTRNIRELLKEC